LNLSVATHQTRKHVHKGLAVMIMLMD